MKGALPIFNFQLPIANGWALLTLLFYPIYSNAQTDTTQQGKVHWQYQNPKTGFTEKGQYKDGKRNGLWEFYNVKGKLVKREKYKHGQFWWAIYYKENGKVAYSINRKGKMVKRSDCGC